MKTLRSLALPIASILLPVSTTLAQRDSSAVESKSGLVVSVSAPASDVGAAILAKEELTRRDEREER